MRKKQGEHYRGGSTVVNTYDKTWFGGYNDKKPSKYDKLDPSGYVPPRSPAEQREYDNFKMGLDANGERQYKLIKKKDLAKIQKKKLGPARVRRPVKPRQRKVARPAEKG